ncbi:MAG: ribosome-associated translation inhibitor RaiA [Dehalococcoidales bacterium]|jgi:putative sigma-54 modulation protein
MEIKIGSKNMDLPVRARAYIEKKLVKLKRRLDDIKEIKVEVSEEKTKAQKDRYIIRIVLDCYSTLLHTEERGETIQSAMDKALPVTERQFERWKGKLEDRGKNALPTGIAMAPPADTEPATLTERKPIVKVKRFAIKPMHIEEAVDQMELLRHDFFLFTNSEDNKVNLLYRRKDGNYGLITAEPE